MINIKGTDLKKMFISGANNLQNHKELVDKLNVFPVPDGDTGTNMSLTISYAIKELLKSEVDDITNIGKVLSKGFLMGARGNSGVILSQIVRGFAKSIEGKETLNTVDLADALKLGSDTAYKAVIKPIEGTILTVVRESAEYAQKIAKKEDDVVRFFELVIGEANQSLKRTPELLKSLKEAGVIDSGGKGLILIYEGMYNALKNNPIELKDSSLTAEPTTNQLSNVNSQDIEFGYCTEFILETDKVDDTHIRDIMLKYGDSLAVVGDDGIIKVHVHTNDPGLAIQEALKFGQLLTIKIENMRFQHENTLLEKGSNNEEVATLSEEEKEYGFIATSMGEGLAEIFKGFGVDYVIEGGQTMNPSTEDFLKAINSINARNIFIFPNNSNVIMAANQAKDISDKNIIVIPTKNTPQAFSALVNFNSEDTVKENEEVFNSSLEAVKCGQVTYAVRNTTMNGIDVKEDDIIALSKGTLISSGDSVNNVTCKLVEELVDDETSIVTLYYGDMINEEDANTLLSEIQAKFDDIDIELYYGGQPVYHYLVSVE